MATLLQQWARRYLQIIQRNHAPHVRAHIREYFFRGTYKFGIIGLAEFLPCLLLVSVLLFFVGLVGFAFQANQTVAHITIACVGLCFLAYMVLTLTPLIFLNCPYYTPLTSIILFTTQKVPLFFSSVLYRGTKYLHKNLGSRVGADRVKRYHDTYKKKAKSWSEDAISKLSSLATKRISLDIYKTALTWTLLQLDQDHELEEFVAGIPSLYESDAFSLIGADDDGDVQPEDNIRPVLAVLPGPTSSDAPLPWSIIRLAQRTISSEISKTIRQRRTQACLRALYYIPGAIRDVLAPYAAREYFCLVALPLLNSPDSLKIIDELWDSPNDDVALSVRCAAAVVAAFMITPPHSTLNIFVSPTVGFVGHNIIGEQFLANRLRVDPNADTVVAPEFHPNSDTARLQNIVRFLADINDTLHFMNREQWTPDSAESILRQDLFDQRKTFLGLGKMIDHQGDRSSPAFVPAVQQDLITLTLEILARYPVAKAAQSQREAFNNTFTLLEEEAMVQAPKPELVVVLEAQPNLDSGSPKQAKSANSIEMVKLALDPVFQALQASQNTTPPATHTSPP